MGQAEPVDNVIRRGSGAQSQLRSLPSSGTSVPFVGDLQVEFGLDKILRLVMYGVRASPLFRARFHKCVYVRVHLPRPRCLRVQPRGTETKRE